jgi:hypothetical protein
MRAITRAQMGRAVWNSLETREGWWWSGPETAMPMTGLVGQVPHPRRLDIEMLAPEGHRATRPEPPDDLHRLFKHLVTQTGKRPPPAVSPPADNVFVQQTDWWIACDTASLMASDLDFLERTTGLEPATLTMAR